MKSSWLVRVLFAAWVLPLSVAAQDAERIEWTLAKDMAEIEAAIEKARSYPSHDALEQIFLKKDYSIERNEAVVRVRRIWRFPTAGSVQEFGAERIHFDGDRDEVTVEIAASIQPDGTPHWLHPGDAQLARDDRPAVYTDSRRLDIWYPALEPGSLAIIDYTIRSSLQDAESIWSSRQLLQNLYPRRELELVGRWADGMALQWTQDLDDLECDAGANRFRCTARNVPAAIHDEGILWRDVLAEFVVSLAPDWPTVVELARSRFREAFDDLGGLDQTVRELLDGASGNQEKIARLHEFASTGVRYVSVSRHGNRITPKSIASTLELRLGDCKDKAALLVAMLDAAGIDAHPVLVATDRTELQSPELADMHYFDHMVVCLEDGDRCLDPTDAYTDASATSPWIQGKVALPLQPGARPGNIPVEEYRWHVDVDTRLQFHSDGSQTETVSRTYKGEYAGLIRGQLQPMTASERVEWAVTQYADIVNDTVEPTVTFSGVDELSEELVIETETYYPDVLVYENPLNYSEFAPWLRSEIHSMLLNNRIHQRDFAGLRATATHRFELPLQWQIVFPGPELRYENEYGSYHRDSESEGRRVTYEAILELPYRPDVGPQEAERANDTLDWYLKESLMYWIATQDS